jgi:cell shape-determining protein MreC
MKYVSGSTPVEIGQQIFTTGQDDIYPAGLKIGEIVNVISGSATTPHQIIIQPAGRLGSMQEVGILLYEPPDKGQFEQKIQTAPKKK